MSAYNNIRKRCSCVVCIVRGYFGGTYTKMENTNELGFSKREKLLWGLNIIRAQREGREGDISVLRNKQSELRYLLGQVVSIKSKLKALTYADVKEKKRLYLELEKIKFKEEEILISLNN